MKHQERKDAGSDPKKDEIAKLVEQTIEGLIEEALVVGDTGRMEFDPAGARGVITKALTDYEALRHGKNRRDHDH
jgi:hypothetical protein